MAVFVRALALFVLAPSPLATGRQRGTPTPADVVQAFFDAYERLDIDAMAAVMAPDMMYEDPTFRLQAKDRADWSRMAEVNRQAITSIDADILATVAADDTLAVEYTLSGGIRAEDGVRQFKVRCASFFRVRSGLIARSTDYCDYRTFTEQTRPASPVSVR